MAVGDEVAVVVVAAILVEAVLRSTWLFFAVEAFKARPVLVFAVSGPSAFVGR